MLVGMNHPDASHVGGHPQCAIIHLQDVVYVLVDVFILSNNFLECSGLRVEKRQSVFGAYPQTLSVVLENLAHIIAW